MIGGLEARMGKGTRRGRRRDRRERIRALNGRSLPDILLHPQGTDAPVWKYFIPVLVLAFAARAGIALYSDFFLHADELYQVLEQGHRLAFGNGLVPWEYFYGVRPLLLPVVVAGMLMVFDVFGLGQPVWYVDGVKLLFCAISLLIPAGMYFFARQHFGETSGRVALLAGAFWYELVGFAHKPLAEFVATGLLLVALAVCMRPSSDKIRTKIWLLAFLPVMLAALRIQYAPIAFMLLGLFFLRTEKKMAFGVVVVTSVIAVGVFDALTWGGGLFHSYISYFRYHNAYQTLVVSHIAKHPGYQYLIWLAIASVGLGLLCVVLALRDVRRYGFLLVLLIALVVLHSVPGHKEYRYIFLAIPLFLMIGADIVAQFAMNRKYLCAAVVFVVVSVGGILERLPYQDRMYLAFFGQEPHKIGIIDKQNLFLDVSPDLFDAYRYLAQAPDVVGVWQLGLSYPSTPGYYYLHHKIPFYDRKTGMAHIGANLNKILTSVSHIVSLRDISIPAYMLEKKFGSVRIYCREQKDLAVRQWEHHTPVFGEAFAEGMLRTSSDARPFPPNAGIRFLDEDRR
ncbi:MAG: hypothetical protein OXH16_01370 [Gemmatimonadetes bacterium]|nr:hypothetical protein [Gemmatimonadota bacterium]